MSIKFNGAQISLSIANYQPTDFSKVTARPEFVLKGKTFHDETGQLKTGTAALSLTGVDTSDATATEGDVVAGATFYAGGEKKTGTMPDYHSGDFAIGYTNGDSGELKIGYSAAQKTYFNAASGALIDTIYDQNFIAGNIKKDTSIFGVVGTYKGGTDSPLPTEVSTEAEMTALLTSGEVGGVYKYTGTTGTYENGALYVLEEETESIVGTWVFNDTLVDYESFQMDGHSENFNFSSNGKNYSTMMFDGVATFYLVYDTTRAYSGSSWNNQAYKTINITTEPTNDSFIAWLKANATKQ